MLQEMYTINIAGKFDHKILILILIHLYIAGTQSVPVRKWECARACFACLRHLCTCARPSVHAH